MRRRLSLHQLSSVILTLGFALVVAAGAQAECHGKDLIAAMPPKERAALEARADAAPFARGNLWQARKDGETLTIVGTYHLGDPRQDALLAALGPAIRAAHLVLVEAGPAEMKSLKAQLLADPSLIVAPPGQSLYAELPHDTWAELSAALKDRGVPAMIATRLRPWYVMVLLQTATCDSPGDTAGGLDMMIMKAAEARGLAIRSLEPASTVFDIFNGMSLDDQLALLNTALAGAAENEDGIVTLANAYFRGESRLMWEFTAWQTAHQPGISPQEAARQQALMKRRLIADRNRAWVPVIEKAAKGGPVLVAFGALHLSGKTGVLELLAEDGWKVTPLPK